MRDRWRPLIVLPVPHHSGAILPVVFKDDQRGNTLYMVGRSQGGIFINIYFENGCLITCHGFELFQNRWHHLTGAAPFRGKITNTV